NAIDFTADKAFDVADNDFYVSESSKLMRGGEPIEPRTTFYESTLRASWIIPGRSMIDCLSDMYVDLPEGVAAQLVIRSTLSRNGLLLTSGLYDSGFKGHIGFLLHNLHEHDAVVAHGTRVGQIIFVSSDSAGTYAGGYNHELGTDLEYQE
ncbi:MAG: dCTP deaminase domain-containing protein, partial [Candidatus Kariarchaeaceae archaeon]